MVTFRELARTPEFGPLFAASSAHVAAQTVSGLALGTLLFAETGSPLLAALGMFGPSLAQLLGASTLLSAADRLPPRAALAGLSMVLGISTAVQAIPDLPVAVTFAVLLGVGTITSLGGGVRYGLLNEILTPQGYLLGRAMLNMSVGAMQIGGYLLGGALLALVSPAGALLTGAALHVAAAVVAVVGLTRRPARAVGRPSVAQTWRGNAQLWSARSRRYVYLGLWVPNGLVVGCESLYVSYAPQHAGVLFASAAFGMLVGDTAVGRFVPSRWRGRLAVPMLLLLAAPHLVFVFRPGLGVAAVAVAVACAGYGASLLLQERLMALTPTELTGHALGLHTSGMLAMQGIGAMLAGSVAQLTSPAIGITAMAAASIAVTALIAPGLRATRSERAEDLEPGLPQRDGARARPRSGSMVEGDR
ncbi:MFS transporter [Actinomycetes bacterium KLBMP 9759]